jgi:peptidoglycan/xylan/chitin deacetylase (PgdA/CDA1 family)
MGAMWSNLKGRVSHRLAMHLRVDSFRLRNKTPMVSFTFDDIPKSAATTGARMLEQYSAHGTFYVSGGLVGRQAPHWQPTSEGDLVALHRKGHEVACHTFSHSRACDLDARQLDAEIEKNRQYLQTLDASIKIQNFAYPYGVGSLRGKRQLKSAFRSCRGIVPGVNSGTVDIQYLRATPLVQELIDDDGIDRAFDEARTNNGWLIFYTHDVVDRPSPYGCSPGLMKHALEAASRRKIPVLSMAEALQCAGA